MGLETFGLGGGSSQTAACVVSLTIEVVQDIVDVTVEIIQDVVDITVDIECEPA